MLVYKYRGGAFERDLKSLKNNEFWASNTKQLNDPCEGLITSSAYQQQINVANSNMRCDSFKSHMIINKLSKFL